MTRCGGGKRVVDEWLYPGDTIDVATTLSSDTPHNVIQSGRTLMVEYPNINGSGVMVTARATLVGNNNGGNVQFDANGIGNLGGAGQVNGRMEYNIQFSRSVILRSMRLWDYDANQEQLFSMVPLATAYDPNLLVVPCSATGNPSLPNTCVRSTVNNNNGNAYYNLELSVWQFQMGWPNDLGIAVNDFAFTVPSWRSAYLDECDEEWTWRDLVTNDPVDPMLLRRNSFGG